MGFGNLAMTVVYFENTKKEAKGKQLSLTRQKKQNRMNRAPLKLKPDLLINFVKANKAYWRQGCFLNLEDACLF
jgi:G:T-mismatch repair DNA endonuclease (very short patch repair protein)